MQIVFKDVKVVVCLWFLWRRPVVLLLSRRMAQRDRQLQTCNDGSKQRLGVERKSKLNHRDDNNTQLVLWKDRNNVCLRAETELWVNFYYKNIFHL